MFRIVQIAQQLLCLFIFIYEGPFDIVSFWLVEPYDDLVSFSDLFLDLSMLSTI